MTVIGANLISLHGNFLAYDAASASFISSDESNNINKVFVDIGHKDAIFYIINDEKKRYINFNNSIVLSEEINPSSSLTANFCENCFCRFGSGGMFLSANPDGTYDFKVWKERYEKFFIHVSGGLSSIILSSSWYSCSQGCVVKPRLLHDYKIEIGGYTINLDELELGSALGDKEILVTYEIYCVDRLIKWNPLVYFTVFGNDAAFNALRLCVDSFERYGKYSGNYLVLTDRNPEELKRMLPSSCCHRLIVKHVTAFDVIDYVNARFAVSEIEDIQKFQPIIYSDIDIICSSSLDPILEKSIIGETIYTRLEGESHLIHYGSTLMNRDRFPRLQNSWGFNSGVIAFRDVRQVKLLFEAIKISLRNNLEAGLSRHDVEAYDQPVANYVFNKVAIYDTEFLVDHVHPCLPEFDEEMSSRGLVHFCGGVGADHKIDRMIRFLARLDKNAESTKN